MKNLNNELNKSKTRKLEDNSQNLQVNYVSNNDYHITVENKIIIIIIIIIITARAGFSLVVGPCSMVSRG